MSPAGEGVGRRQAAGAPASGGGNGAGGRFGGGGARVRPAPEPRYVRPIQELILSPWVLIPLSVILGAFVASQFFNLQARYIKFLGGILFLLAIARTPLYVSLCIFVVIFPFPSFIWLGDTNLIFIGALLVIWAIRIGLREVSRPARSPIDWAILFFILFHFVSIMNVGSVSRLTNEMTTMAFTLAGIALFYLLYNGIRTESHLRALLNALCICALLVDVTAIYEIFTGRMLVPEWLLFTRGQSRPGGSRVGGVFGAHALLADFSAIMFYVQVCLGMRSRSVGAKVYYYALAALGVLMIGATLNRGGAAIWLLGGAWYLWYFRRHFGWSRFALMALFVLCSLGAGMVVFADLSPFQLGIVRRMTGTRFIHLLPENRVEVWGYMLQRIREHIWIGHGPFVDIRQTGALRWPHNAFLFYWYTIGLFGLASFVWIVVKLIRSTAPRTNDIDFVRLPLSTAMLALTHILLVMFVMAQLRSDHQRGNVYIYFMWILFALAAVSARLAKQERKRQAEVAAEAEAASRPLAPADGLPGAEAR